MTILIKLIACFSYLQDTCHHYDARLLNSNYCDKSNRQQMQRYQASPLNLLAHTRSDLLYSPRKTNSSWYVRHVQQAPTREKINKNRSMSDNKQRDSQSGLAIRQVFKKMNEIVDRDNCCNSSLATTRRSFSLTQQSEKKKQLFRITNRNKPNISNINHRKKPAFKAHTSQLVPSYKPEEEHMQEFRVKGAVIERKISVNDPQVYHNLGLNRTFLKLHGQNKCFEKAVQFKKCRPRQLAQVAKIERQKLDSFNNLSLDYSQDDLGVAQLEGWKMSAPRQMELSLFSHFQQEQQ